MVLTHDRRWLGRSDRSDMAEKDCVENECTGFKESGIIIHHIPLTCQYIQISIGRAVSSVLLECISH
jgi:hypothetical protein